MTLRPEGTASAMRSFAENQLHRMNSCYKLYYIGPMFRYERPQAGRYRQHHQFGAESIGLGLPEQDAEAIDLLCELYRRLGLKNLTVYLNSVGDESTRDKFRKSLMEFLTPKFEQLSEDSKVRFSKNILRILDSKDPVDQKLLEGAPSILDCLSEDSMDHFLKVQKLLKTLNLHFAINPRLVRGLDYYNKTVFEITSGELGAQNTIGGGGRYDGLLSLVGGPNLPAVGFATGIERILQSMIGQQIAFPPPPHPYVYLIPLGEKAQDFCFNFLFTLRHAKIPAEIQLQGKKIQQALQIANELHAEYTLIIGDEEIQTQKVKLKEMHSRKEISLNFSELFPHIQELWNHPKSEIAR